MTALAISGHAAPHGELLVVTLGELRLGLLLGDVEEIVRAVAISALPKAPPITEGIIDVRGRIVPVVNLRVRFGQPPRAVCLDDHFVLARAGGRTIALRADGPARLARYDADALCDARLIAEAEHVAGIATLPDGIVAITDLVAVLSEAEARALDEAIHEAVHVRAETA